MKSSDEQTNDSCEQNHEATNDSFDYSDAVRGFAVRVQLRKFRRQRWRENVTRYGSRQQ